MNQNSTDVHCNLPATHSFVYCDKKYPFNIFLFNCFSEYFHSNIYNQQLDINISDELNDESIISEDSIKDFINYCQKTDITLNNKNVLEIHKLSSKFKVPSLVKATEDYISAHRNDFVIQFLTMNPDEQTSSTEQYEDIISNYLPEYIQDERLVSFPIPFLSRVLTKYQLKNDNHTNSEVVQFLFKCLDHHGKKASVLFENIDLCNEHANFLKDLFSDKYSNKFDFHFINTQYHKKIYEMQSEIIQKEQFIRENNEHFANSINDVKNKCEQNLAELKDKQKEEFTGELNKLKTEQKEEFTGELNNLRNELKEEFNRLIFDEKNKILEELNRSKTENERKLQEQASLFDQKMRDLENSFNEKLRQKDDLINQLSNKIKKINEGFKCENGIFEFLRSISNVNGNPYESKLVDVETSRVNCGEIKNLFDKSKRTDFRLENVQNNYIIFDFKDKRVNFSKYYFSVPESELGHDAGQPKSWIIEGSNDKQAWDPIDNKSNDTSLHGYGKSCTFTCTNISSNFYRFIRIKEITEKRDRFFFLLSEIEFYGSYKNI